LRKKQRLEALAPFATLGSVASYAPARPNNERQKNNNRLFISEYFCTFARFLLKIKNS
jgi:hypothetical protein